MDVSGPLTASLAALELRPEDSAAVALAKRYAHDLDDAAVVSASLAKALRELLDLSPDLHDRFLALATRIESTAVLASIGPKLLAVLTELNMTPRARAALGTKGGGGHDGAGKSKIDELRQRRSARQHAAPAVD